MTLRGCIMLAGLLLVGCQDPAPQVEEQIELSPAQRAAILARHNAVPTVGASPGPVTLYVAGRSEVVADCGTCHEAGTMATRPKTRPEQRAAHWEISLDHAEGMTCRSCHDPFEPNRLAVLASKTTSVDRAYQLCGTCHSTQLADWRGGAHGKRLTGWAEPRVVKNCAGCHDPHQPSIAKQYPVAHPTIVPERVEEEEGGHAP